MVSQVVTDSLEHYYYYKMIQIRQLDNRNHLQVQGAVTSIKKTNKWWSLKLINNKLNDFF